MVKRWTVFTAGALALAACAEPEDPAAGGLAVEVELHGPAIVFEPLELPLPEVPFPNDLTLRVVDDTRTGKAWNLSTEKASEHRRELFKRANRTDGFGPFAPIFVPFDGPLDLATVTDDSVLVINIQPGSARLGERVPLDLGRGHYPTDMEVGAFFGQDPQAANFDLLFGAANWLDPVSPGGDPQRLLHYEVESDTLILRPIVPLEQGAEHAVLITRDVQGWRMTDDGPTEAPVRSPFPYKAHAAQSEAVRRALEVAGLEPSQLAFGWTYTTADVVTPALNLRKGLYGQGPVAFLNDARRPGLLSVRDTGITHDANGDQFPEDPQDHRFILQAEFVSQIFEIVAGVQGDDNFKLSFPHVDYVVFGSVESPDVRTGYNKSLGIDLFTGAGDVVPNEVPFVAAIPKATETHKPPFPVMFYFHGTGTSRMEALAISDAMARQGIAVVAFDQVGHGPLIPDIPTLLAENPEQAGLARALPPLLANLLVPDRAREFRGLELEEALAKFEEIGFFRELAVVGRSEDVDGDGYKAIAEGFYAADPFRQCATFFQDLVDFMALVKVIRGFDPDAVPPAVPNPAQASDDALLANLMAGDFNADGVLDLGGPVVPFSAAGTSLGGFHALLGAALEPEVTTVTPIVAGGGFTDIMLRSSLRFITERLFLDVFGMVVVGCPDGEGGLWVSQGNDAEECRPRTFVDGEMAKIAAVPTGTAVRLQNLDNGEVAFTTVNAGGGFSLAVETDRGDRVAVTVGDGEPLEFISKVKGSALERNTPDFRKSIGVFQHIFDQCDPVNFAHLLFLDPPEGHPVTNVLFLNAVGDDTVPVSTAIQLGLAAGVFGSGVETWRPRVQPYLDTGLARNGHYDVDDVRGDNPPELPAPGVQAPIETATGLSSIRFADVNGKHEYIAGYSKDEFQFGHYHQHLLAVYHRCQGQVVLDQPAECLQNRDCELLDQVDTLPGCPPMPRAE